VKPVFQLSTSTPTQDGPAATTPTKGIVPAASASTEVYVPASSTPTEAHNNLSQQQLEFMCML
jgi:hypothetical protein